MSRVDAAVAAAVLALVTAVAAPAAVSDKISPALDRAFERSATGRAEMLIVLAEQADLSPARQQVGREARGRFVYDSLTATAARTQGPLLAELARLGAPSRPFWAANFIWTEGDAALAETLAERDDVARLDTNPQMVLEPPTIDLFQAPAEAPAAVEWNIAKVNADDVWGLGYTGQGAVIAGQDTGYKWDHAALKGEYRGWNGSSANHNYNWHDAIHSGGGSCGPDSTQPCDDQGHGTHTMGTMVGDDGAGNQVGMAPGARWIGCRNMNVGVGTPTTYIECFQWFIAPTDLAGLNPDPAMAPDVINNSWGCPADEGCNPANFAVMQAVVENVRAAGIFVAVSAGNDGSACSTVNTPAAIYDASFSVGATDVSDLIAGFSSRGPVTVDGSNRMKPDISAPGVNIRSSTRDGSYQGGWDGTSMAGPHVAGLVGLMVSAVPAVAGDVTRIEDLIRESANHPTFGGQCGVTAGIYPNNTFGAGRIDALAAVNLLLSQADFQTTVTPAAQAVCAPADAVYNVAVGQLGSFNEPVTLVATGNPASSTVGFSTNPVTPPGGSTMTVTTAGVSAGSSTITITGTANPSGTVRSDTATLAVFTAAAAQPVLAVPVNGALNVPVPAALSWGAAAQAGSYTVQVATDAGFANIVEQASALASPAYSATSLNTNTLYYWRVQATNECGSSSFSAVFNFRTVAAPGDCTSGTTANPLYQYGFEAGVGGWTHSGTGDSWAISNANPHSGTALFHANDPAAVSDQRLVSPAVSLPAGQNPVVLKFWHLPNLENSGATACYDGGILEVSTDAGATWNQVPNASLLVGAYTGLVSTSFSNPLAGLAAWCNATAYIQTIADVSAYAGQTVQFRLRLGSDTSASDAGWDVDDVVIQSCAPALTGIFSDGFQSGDTSQWSAVLP